MHCQHYWYYILAKNKSNSQNLSERRSHIQILHIKVGATFTPPETSDPIWIKHFWGSCGKYWICVEHVLTVNWIRYSQMCFWPHSHVSRNKSDTYIGYLPMQFHLNIKIDISLPYPLAHHKMWHLFFVCIWMSYQWSLPHTTKLQKVPWCLLFPFHLAGKTLVCTCGLFQV